MGSMMSTQRRKLYVQAQDISDVPPWAADVAARRLKASNHEKAECVRRLQAEQDWTMAMVAKLFGVSLSAVSRWLRADTEEGAARDREVQRERRARDPYKLNHHERTHREEVRHGEGARAAMWRDQDGRCYLCREPLGPERMAVIEHDHRCCPANKSCADCRRGLACNPCNQIIGFAHDDPDLLERIAANLRPAMAKVTERLSQRGA